MTFQVVLIGNHGLVVGSDRKVNYLTPIHGNNPIVQRAEQPKFKKNKTESIFCFYAGGADASQQASNIVRSATLDNNEESWEASIKDAAATIHRILRQDIVNELLVIRRDQPQKAWYVKSLPPETIVSAITTAFCTGMYSDARFLVSRLWLADFSVAELKRLALLTLAYAAKDNSGNIGGSFDIVKLGVRDRFVHEHYASVDSMFKQFDTKLKAALADLADVTASNS